METQRLQKLKLFVKGIPKNTSEAALLKFFSKFGAIDRVLSFTKADTKKAALGFAYIIMKEKRDFSKLIRIGTLSFRGKKLKVEASRSQYDLEKKKKSFPPQVPQVIPVVLPEPTKILEELLPPLEPPRPLTANHGHQEISKLNFEGAFSLKTDSTFADSKSDRDDPQSPLATRKGDVRCFPAPSSPPKESPRPEPFRIGKGDYFQKERYSWAREMLVDQKALLGRLTTFSSRVYS